MEFPLLTALLSVVVVAATAAGAAAATASPSTKAATSATASAAATEGQEKEADVTVRMPGVRPTRPDTYLCAGVKLGDAPTRVVGYDPLAHWDTTHHMLLYSCGKPGSDAPVWNCGGMGGGSGSNSPGGGMPSGPTCLAGSNLIYAWANAAPALRLPEGVAFNLPANDTLVVQVHYATVEKFVNGCGGARGGDEITRFYLYFFILLSFFLSTHLYIFERGYIFISFYLFNFLFFFLKLCAKLGKLVCYFV